MKEIKAFFERELRRTKINLSSKGAQKLCAEHGLLSPYYQYSKRGGCFFCPNAQDDQLRHIYRNYPDLWDKMLELQKEPNIVRPGKFRIDEGLYEINARFELEGEQMDLFEEMEMLDEGT